jgi:hypothetical protein
MDIAVLDYARSCRYVHLKINIAEYIFSGKRVPATPMWLPLRKPCRIGAGAELPRDQGRITRIPWGRRKYQGRGSLQPVALQKQLQGGPAGSPHGAAPALNAFHLSAWMPLQVHPANIRAGNFLFAAIAGGWISLVPYLPFRRVGICNLA